MTKKLVIIDDSSTQLNILKTLFTNNGWEVCGVQSAKIGYELIFDFAPDLVITDAIMPVMGGFQLIKQIRRNPLISKIPVIVYSVLSEINAKFYINEELSEYFLKKDNNQDELLKLAKKITEKFPLEKEYKEEILKTGLKNYIPIQESPKKEETDQNTQENSDIEEKTKKIFELEKFKNNIKQLSDFSDSDEKIFQKLYSILFDTFEYDLGILNIYSFEKKENETYFDIRNIILSPILKNFILNACDSKISVLYKKYAPNLVTITKESEFLSKIEFDFEYKNESVAKAIFYSKEEAKWENFEEKESIKEVLFDFFKTRYIKKSTQMNLKDDTKTKYRQLFDKFADIKNSQDAYFSIIQIANYSDLIQNISSEDIDILNLKISEKIIECLEKDEQVYKNEEDEYSVVFFAKDQKHAKYRLEYIIKELSAISYNTNFLNAYAFASSSKFEDTFNIIEAQKNARKLIDESNYQESVMIYNE